MMMNPRINWKGFREAKGWTQEKTAAKVGLTLVGYRRIEKGGDTKMSTLLRLVEVFEITLVFDKNGARDYDRIIVRN